MSRALLALVYAMSFTAFSYCAIEALVGEAPAWRGLLLVFTSSLFGGFIATRGAR